MRGTLAILLLTLVTGCIKQEMDHQAKYLPFGEGQLFDNGSDMRQLPPGTIPRGYLPIRPAGAVVKPGPDKNQKLPPQTPRPMLATPGPVSLAMLQAGQRHYNVYCAPCHGLVGDGNGIIPRHGFPKPPSYHIKRLRNAPDGHFYDVMTDGYGYMYPYANRVTPQERWAIVAYIRALQLSQNARLSDVPATARAGLQGGAP